jgi:hypothetical protein
MLVKALLFVVACSAALGAAEATPPEATPPVGAPHHRCRHRSRAAALSPGLVALEDGAVLRRGRARAENDLAGAA